MDMTLKICVKKLPKIPHKPAQPYPLHILLEIGSVGPSRIAKINKELRKQSKPTDILSFRWESPVEAIAPSENVTGSIMLCADAIKKKWRLQIKDYGIKAVYHRLIIHGFVHLMGFDHEKKVDRLEMTTVERYLGVPKIFLD
jgi:rRNA maturation RNase YbeY